MPEGFSELVIQAFAVPWSLEVRAGREMNFYATIAPLLDEPGEDVGDFAVGMLMANKEERIRHTITSYRSRC